MRERLELLCYCRYEYVQAAQLSKLNIQLLWIN